MTSHTLWVKLTLLPSVTLRHKSWTPFRNDVTSLQPPPLQKGIGSVPYTIRAVSIIQEKSIDMIAQCLYYDKSTKQNSFQLKSMSINVTLGLYSFVNRSHCS